MGFEFRKRIDVKFKLFYVDEVLDEWNFKLWDAARDSDEDAVSAAVATGGDVNWNNDSYVNP